MNELMKISTALMNSDLFKSLQETTDRLAGGTSIYNRISLKGGKFRLKVGKEQVGKPRTEPLNIVIIEAAELSRTYYEGDYDSDNPTPPTCWSSDSKKPDSSVPADQRQSTNCKDCPMAVKGSGQGQSAACRFSQRLAVALDTELDEPEIPVYQLSLPAKSVFGAAENGHMPMQAYGKMLKSHKVPAMALVTEMYFDEDSETPKVFFRPKRMLTEDELRRVVDLRDSDIVKELLTLTVAEVDAHTAEEDKPAPTKAKPAAQAKEKAPAKAKPSNRDEDEDEDVGEPVKVSKKAEKREDAIDEDLASLIDDWED